MYLNRLHRHNNIKCINHSQISTNNLTTTAHTYHNQQQYNQSYSNHQQPQQTSQFSDHAKEVTEESKGFFRSAFASPDQVLKANKHLVLNCYFLLIIVGLLVVALLLAIVIPSSVGMFETPKAKLSFLLC